jgi:hypothetical protein
MAIAEEPPDHSTISRTGRLIDLETDGAVFTWMLRRRADAGLVKGNTVGIDATTLEANAALGSTVRRDTGESFREQLLIGQLSEQRNDGRHSGFVSSRFLRPRTGAVAAIACRIIVCVRQAAEHRVGMSRISTRPARVAKQRCGGRVFPRHR